MAVADVRRANHVRIEIARASKEDNMDLWLSLSDSVQEEEGNG
jgi:hypothetical protein